MYYARIIFLETFYFDKRIHYDKVFYRFKFVKIM